MGVFLSKPSVTKFSEDGEDDHVGFGVSSMQGWRRGMEDAHVALLDVGQKSKETPGLEEDEGGSGGSNSKIRMFGVFDGHGGKEVALFVQEHMAEELTKLQEYKGGDFPGALVRVFHRMDELLEGAATELLRSRGMLPEECGDLVAAGPREGEGTRVSEAAAADGAGEEGKGEGGGEDDTTGGGAGGSAEGGTGRPGGQRAKPEGLSVERCKEILDELSEYRSRKNPSDVETENRSSKGRPMLGSGADGSGADYDSDEDDEDGAPRGAGGHAIQNGDGGGGGRPVDEDGDEVLELGTAAGGEGSGGGRKIKMVDALELFHRILDIRKDQHRGAVAASPYSSPSSADPDPAAAAASSVGGGAETDSSSCPPLPRTGTAIDGEDGGAKPAGGGFDQVAPSAGGMGGSDEKGVAGSGWLDDKREEEGEGEEGGGVKLALPSILGAGSPDDEGEDTFGDSDESEEDDVVVTPGSAPSGQAAGARPRLGLGASLASIVHGRGGSAPTCNLEDHPIQAGCTSVVCLMAGNMLHVANAGDSRAVLCRGGVAVALSHDHKPMSVTEKTRIQRAGGFVNAAGRVNGNLNLSRSIGDLKYKANSSLPPADQMITAEPDVLSMEVTDEDRFMIMACDGVWDCMTSQECVDFVGSRVGKMSLSRVCEEVMDACLSDDPRRTTGIGGDNMTCIVVLLDKSFSAADLPSPAAEATADVSAPAIPDEKDALGGASEPEGDDAVGSASSDAVVEEGKE
eukprot:g19787.t1